MMLLNLISGRQTALNAPGFGWRKSRLLSAAEPLFVGSLSKPDRSCENFSLKRTTVFVPDLLRAVLSADAALQRGKRLLTFRRSKVFFYFSKLLEPNVLVRMGSTETISARNDFSAGRFR